MFVPFVRAAVSAYRYAVAACVALTVVLAVLRVVALAEGRGADAVLTSAFASSVAVTVAVLGAWHVANGH